jgi:hypothetical protein
VADPVGTPLANIGDPNSDSSQVLLGQEKFTRDAGVGLRLRGTHRPSLAKFSRFDWSLFHLFDQRHDASFASNGGSPILSRPFNNQLTGGSDAQVLSYPGLANGTFDSTYRHSLSGGEALASFCLYGTNCQSLELVGGYQFSRLRDALYLHETLLPEPSPLVTPGTRFEVRDEMEAGNDYHLFPIGLRCVGGSETWSWHVRALVALGFVNQIAESYGYTKTFVQETPMSVADGGFLALQPTLGRHSRTQFAWVPQLELRSSRRISSRLSLSAGYSLLLFSQATRVATQIPTSIHPGHLPPMSPTTPPLDFAFDDRTVFVQGLQFGLNVHF